MILKNYHDLESGNILTLKGFPFTGAYAILTSIHLPNYQPGYQTDWQLMSETQQHLPLSPPTDGVLVEHNPKLNIDKINIIVKWLTCKII